MKVYLIILIIFVFVFVFLNFKFTNQNYLDNFYKKNYRFENYGNGNTLGVDQIYCICMPDRKDYMKKQMDNLGISCVILNAITSSDLSSNDYKLLTNNNDYYINTKKTRLPLQLSFTMCYMNAIKNNYQTIIVFEDDLTIISDKNTIINGITEFKKSDFAMFYMGYCWLNCDQQFELNGSIANVKDYSRLLCAHSICYKVSYLKSLINFLYPMNDEFDTKLTKFLKKYKYTVCIPKQVYFDQNKDLGTLNETYNLEGSISINPPTCKLK